MTAQGQFKIEEADRILIITYQGAFNLEGVQLYIKRVKELVAGFAQKPWVLIGDVNKLQVSTTDATNAIIHFMNWLKENNCICIISVMEIFSPMIRYQINMIIENNEVIELQSMEQAKKIAKEVMESLK